jgi:hypothetical protein
MKAIDDHKPWFIVAKASQITNTFGAIRNQAFIPTKPKGNAQPIFSN